MPNNLTRFLGTKTDEIINETKTFFPIHPVLYSNMCFDMIKDNNLLVDSLKQRRTYLRIFGKQDTPHSNSYLECYIREINNMLIPQKQEAIEILSHNNDPDVILFEIGYVTVGFFFLYIIRTREAYQPN